MFYIRKLSVRKNFYNEVYFRKVKNLHCTEGNSAIYGLHHIIFLVQAPKIYCLEKNILTKKSMVYQSFNNKVGILPKRELTLDLPEKPPWWKLFSVKSRVYHCNFIKKIMCLTKIYSSKHLLVSKTSSRYVLKTSWRLCERSNFWFFKISWGHPRKREIVMT